jgi:hypothetical protein
MSRAAAALTGAAAGFAASMTGAILLLAACPSARCGLWVVLLRLSVGAVTAGGVAFGACAAGLAEMRRMPAGPARRSVARKEER